MEIGTQARERVREEFISTRSLLDYLSVIRRAIERESGARVA
jgi:hypothetical protein